MKRNIGDTKSWTNSGEIFMRLFYNSLDEDSNVSYLSCTHKLSHNCYHYDSSSRFENSKSQKLLTSSLSSNCVVISTSPCNKTKENVH